MGDGQLRGVIYRGLNEEAGSFFLLGELSFVVVVAGSVDILLGSVQSLVSSSDQTLVS